MGTNGVYGAIEEGRDPPSRPDRPPRRVFPGGSPTDPTRRSQSLRGRVWVHGDKAFDIGKPEPRPRHRLACVPLP